VFESTAYTSKPAVVLHSPLLLRLDVETRLRETAERLRDTGNKELVGIDGIFIFNYWICRASPPHIWKSIVWLFYRSP
jgi:hypothetical protein